MASSGSSAISLAVAILILASICGQWLSKITGTVPNPYLDEVFHVRQAQVYCNGHFDVWDPKITTPPGLYLLSTVVYYITGRCDIRALRALNTFGTCVILLTVFKIVNGFKGSRRQGETGPQTVTTISSEALTALNISLFPLIFFFSALYYTDIISTSVVLLHYHLFLRSQRAVSVDITSSILLIVVGLVALLYRQTNIFWVAIFPAGLAVLHRFSPSGTENGSAKSHSYATVLERTWTQSELFLLPVCEASLEDYLLFFISLAVVILRNPLTVCRLIVPYIILLFMFGAFVIWNGSVVLGDKSNHVATIHLPQMLYIWPYSIFFALPMAVHALLAFLIQLVPSGVIPPKIHEFAQLPQARRSLGWPRFWTVLLFNILAIVAVHFNTIIHPFTLADNRHYVFYVFRILRMYPTTKYILTPVYVICGWLTVQILGLASIDVPKIRPIQVGAKAGRSKQQSQTDFLFNSVGFVSVWLVTTALSTITAPLVEPRYFIIPWIIWRIHAYLPSDLRGLSITSHGSTESADEAGTRNVSAVSIGWLCFEAMWHLLINISTGYLFLYRGFKWPQEPDSVQRFLW